MKKKFVLFLFSGIFFLASCGGGAQRSEEPELRDTVLIIDDNTDTVPKAPAPTP